MENELSEAHSSAKQTKYSPDIEALTGERTKGLNKSLGLLSTAEPHSDKTPQNTRNEFLHETLRGTEAMVSEFVAQPNFGAPFFPNGFPGGDLDKLDVLLKSPDLTPQKNKYYRLLTQKHFSG